VQMKIRLKRRCSRFSPACLSSWIWPAIKSITRGQSLPGREPHPAAEIISFLILNPWVERVGWRETEISIFQRTKRNVENFSTILGNLFHIWHNFINLPVCYNMPPRLVKFYLSNCFIMTLLYMRLTSPDGRYRIKGSSEMAWNLHE
jgi:hypothetical protein